MKRKGVCYDVGRVYSWGSTLHPIFDAEVTHRELAIIKNGLHCNSVRICGFATGRLMTAAKDALIQGLEVWLSPDMFERSQKETLRYLTKAARAAEELRRKWPEQLVFSVGSESTLIMQGIVEGSTVAKRLSNPSLREIVKAGKHNEPLNAFLARANEAVR